MTVIQSGGMSDDEQKQRALASSQSMERGGLPLNAIERLQEQAARQGKPGSLFTSDLSVNEMLLTHQAGYVPLGQVMGSSVYHIGYQWTANYAMGGGFNYMTYTGYGMEMDVLTRAYYNARHLALGRMQQEAALLGATGVVGVRLDRKSYDWGAGLLEFAAIGTAIRETSAPPRPGPPFLSDLSGQDFWALRLAGYHPVGFALGNCSYFQLGNFSSQMATNGGFFGGSWANQELTDFTQALYQARNLAMSRMQAEALAVGATGIVGADVEVKVEPQEIGDDNNRRIAMLYHYFSIGTAIAPLPGLPPEANLAMSVSLSDLKGAEL